MNQLKNVPIDNLLSLDESSIDSHIRHNYGWSKKGKKKIIIIENKKMRYTLISIISCHKVIHRKIIKGSANAKIFTEFIKESLKKIPKNKTFHIILDNARIHHAKIFKDYIKQISNIKTIYNVPYSPESNPIEAVFNEIKNYLKNKNINKVSELEVFHFLFKIKNEIINNLLYISFFILNKK